MMRRHPAGHEIERFRRALARFSNARHTREEVWYLNALAVSLTAVEMKAGELDARADAFWPMLSAMWANRPMTDQEKAQHDELFRRWMDSYQTS